MTHTQLGYDDATVASVANTAIGLVAKPKDDEQRVRNGQEAWSRLTKSLSWSDWLLVADALDVGRAEAMRIAHTNKPEGRRYNEAFGGWLKATGLDGVHKTTRSQLFKCLACRDEIEKWRAILTTEERLKLNHPDAVLRRWQRTLVTRPDAAPKLSHVAKLKASIVELDEENARMRRDIANGGGDLWAPEDTAKDIANVMFKKLSLSKARAVARELTQLVRAAP